MSEYRIVVEKAKGNYSAYAPSLPGCVATGATRAEARKNMESAIQFHLEDDLSKTATHRPAPWNASRAAG
jgi:predicted RNase H-like HicB family nuclease